MSISTKFNNLKQQRKHAPLEHELFYCSSQEELIRITNEALDYYSRLTGARSQKYRPPLVERFPLLFQYQVNMDCSIDPEHIYVYAYYVANSAMILETLEEVLRNAMFFAKDELMFSSNPAARKLAAHPVVQFLKERNENTNSE